MIIKKNNENKQTFLNTILKNIKADYKTFLKLDNKKDFLKLVDELQTTKTSDDNGTKTILILNKDIITKIKMFVFADDSKITNNAYKMIINDAYFSAYKKDLKIVEQTKEQSKSKYLDNMRKFEFFKQLNLQVYLFNKVVVKDRVTGNFRSL